MKTFERAILMPDEPQDNLGTKKYPTYGEFLMENPFAKKKKKAKKGKKGKKKWNEYINLLNNTQTTQQL